MEFKKVIGAQRVKLSIFRVGTDGIIRGACVWSGRGPTKMSAVEREAYIRFRREALAAAQAAMGLGSEPRKFDILHGFANPTAGKAGPKLRV